MRMTFLALVLALAPSGVLAQVNTTGSLPSAPPTSMTPSTPSTTTTTSLPAARDVAIVTCAADSSTGGGRLLVTSASTSAGVPAVAPGAACAQALADLFVGGFSVIDVLPITQQVQYTLVR